MLDRTAGTATPKSFFERVSLPVGLQIYTLGDEAGHDLDATFSQVAALGYREIELPSLYGRTPVDVRGAADRAGVAIGSLHLSVSSRGQAAGLSLESPPSELGDGLASLGAKNVVLPIAPFPENFRPMPGETIEAAIGRTFAEAGAALWHRAAALLNEKGALLKPFGISLGYHNHNLEFAPIGVTSGWEILVRETDPSLVHFEVDIGWVATAGLDPASFLHAYRGRIAQLHIKDVASSSVTNFALSMRPTEVGTGTLDWSKILPAAHAAGVRHFYVEQEAPFSIPRIEAARQSYDFLSILQA